jgi:hypothetical protein
MVRCGLVSQIGMLCFLFPSVYIQFLLIDRCKHSFQKKEKEQKVLEKGEVRRNFDSKTVQSKTNKDPNNPKSQLKIRVGFWRLVSDYVTKDPETREKWRELMNIPKKGEEEKSVESLLSLLPLLFTFVSPFSVFASTSLLHSCRDDLTSKLMRVKKLQQQIVCFCFFLRSSFLSQSVLFCFVPG